MALKDREILALLVAGACVGWISGLSVSSVASILIASVSGSLLTVVAAVAGPEKPLENEGHVSSRIHVPHIRTFPFAAVLLGLAIGTTLGIAARANSWMSPTVDAVAAKWPDIDRKLINQRLFDQLYPPSSSSPTAVRSVSQSVLFSANEDECQRFRTRTGADLRAELLSSVSSENAKLFARTVSEPDALAAAVKIFICPK